MMAIEVSFTGNCGGDPETRTFQSGSSTTFSVGISQGYFDQQHQWRDQGTAWVRVRPVGRLAEAQLASIRKGVKVLVVGTLKVSEYTGKDGARRTSLDVAARHIGVMQPAQQQSQQGGYAQQQSGGFGTSDDEFGGAGW